MNFFYDRIIEKSEKYFFQKERKNRAEEKI
jgi:hypothetical protein